MGTVDSGKMRSRGCPMRSDLAVAPRGRKQLHLKQRSEEDAEDEAHFNDAEYVNSGDYDTFDIFYIAYRVFPDWSCGYP